MRNFKDLKVWQKSHELTLAIYRSSQKFPATELYGLVTQLRRACVSIEANIAEGCGRRSDRELVRFLRIAMGSATESECHLLIARDLGFLVGAEFNRLDALLNEVKSMLHSLIERICSEGEVTASRAARSGA